MRYFLHTFLACFLLLVGLCVFGFLNMAQPSVAEKPRLVSIPTVQVMPIHTQTLAIPVYTRGLVNAHHETALLAEMGGKIEKMSPDLKQNGRVKKGELLISFDTKAVRLEVQRIVSRIDLLKQQLALLNAEIDADLEVEGMSQPQLYLTKRLLELQTKLSAADSEKKLVELQLQKTKIFAPFDAVVQKVFVTENQKISPGFQVAHLSADKKQQVRLVLSDRQLSILNVSESKLYRDLKIMLRLKEGVKESYWHGNFLSVSRTVDPRSGLKSLVVSIGKPFGEVTSSLQNGQLLEAELLGVPFENIFSIPRKLLHFNNEIYIVDQEKRLKIRKANVLFKGRGLVYLQDFFSPGEFLVETPLEVAVSGMKLNVDLGVDKKHELLQKSQGSSIPRFFLQASLPAKGFFH